jgi:pimeloyl-ACP methyl ester carboxylesterase
VRREEYRLDLRGTSVLVRDIGDGPPVVLLNGIGAHVGMWQPIEHALEGMRVISFDAPGTGRSQTRLTPLTMFGLAGLVEQLFDRLELEQADVVGYSFGGAIAQQFALRAPERIRRLVLAATMPGWGAVPGHLTAMLAVGTPLRYYSQTLYELTGPSVAGGRARHDAAHLRALWRDRAGRAPSVRGYTHQVWAMTMWSSFGSLSKIRVPTLIVVGDDDPLVPLSNPMLMASRMPDARIMVVPGEGHFLLLDRDGAALPPIREFLGAGDLEDAEVWRSALVPDRTQLDHQLRSDGLGALPWGLVSAAVRGMLGWRQDPAGLK